MELDDIVVTKLFDVMTIPIAKGTKRPITNRYCYGLTFCGTDGGRILYEYENRQYLSDYYHADFPTLPHRRNTTAGKPNWNVLCAMPGTLPAASRWWSCRMTRRSFTLQ